MVNLRAKGSFIKLYGWLPIVILYVSVLNEFDLNYLNLEYFSFNFPFILIFFFTLKDFKHFDVLEIIGNEIIYPYRNKLSPKSTSIKTESLCKISGS